MVALEQTQLFRPLGREGIVALRAAAQERRFETGHRIFAEGDPGDGLYVLGDGRVQISVVAGQGAQHVFSHIEPGGVFGEMAVIEDEPRSANAVAVQPCATWFIARQEMLALVGRYPVLAQGLLREISSRLRDFNQQHLREVVQAERLAVVGRFARSIIHDLKNPLNIIGLTSELAGMPQATPEMRQKAVSTIRLQVERISDLVGQILEFTQGPQPDLVLAPLDYGEFVRHVLDDLRAETELKGVRLELAEGLADPGLAINPKRLRRVFTNLIHNACEAMPGGGVVRVRWLVKDHQVLTEIEDSGPGIAPEILGRLFEPFATHGKVHGTGLGLSICKRIVEDHRGWMSARNEPRRGAIFTFALPLPPP